MTKYFGFALADSMFAGDCTIERHVVTVDQIRAMADIFENVYVIDLEKYGPDYESPEFKSRYFLMGHLNAAGSQYTAWMFLTYIDWIIEHNIEAFSGIAFI